VVGVIGILLAIAAIAVRVTTGTAIDLGVVKVATQSVLIGANTVILAGILMKL
jgi:hypothetical protein